MAEFDPAENVGTIAVQERHQFDINRLQAFMQDNVDGFSGTVTAEEFAGGQSNPTYLLTAGEQQYVMRRKPPGELLKSAHAVIENIACCLRCTIQRFRQRKPTPYVLMMM